MLATAERAQGVKRGDAERDFMGSGHAARGEQRVTLGCQPETRSARQIEIVQRQHQGLQSVSVREFNRDECCRRALAGPLSATDAEHRAGSSRTPSGDPGSKIAVGGLSSGIEHPVAPW